MQFRFKVTPAIPRFIKHVPVEAMINAKYRKLFQGFTNYTFRFIVQKGFPLLVVVWNRYTPTTTCLHVKSSAQKLGDVAQLFNSHILLDRNLSS
ncbi:hypothetical protein [Rhizobium leguminosarum]|uniref:hypothetical protein n=1 Tax=Rhizobium leguminosarum TaxID=384 RepID=UPI001C96DA14|nr:hypothetical protein [Rhizobium leguminosarum]MBY5416083.1 hypothetical protein [Rhizobium leguminosarum]